jgi:hypothetical protein
MKYNQAMFRPSILLFGLFCSLFLTSCANQGKSPVPTQANPTPTLVQSAVTLTNVPLPTATPSLPPTPSFTPLPSATLTMAPSATTVSTQTALPPTPTITKTKSLPFSAQVLRVWSYQNKKEYVSNEGFLLAVYLKNTGTESWGPGYQLRYTGQTNDGFITVQPVVDLTVIVPPGGKVEFDMWAFASETLGPDTWFFSLFDEKGKIIPGSQADFSLIAIHN